MDIFPCLGLSHGFIQCIQGESNDHIEGDFFVVINPSDLVNHLSVF